MNLILLIGLSLFTGTLLGRLVKGIKIPQVTGYIFVGLLFGASGFHLWTSDAIEHFTPFTQLVLGIIGFMLGGELKLGIFKSRGKSIYSILFSQGLMTFVLVTLFVYMVTRKFFLGILLGAIATATDPASTVDVIWENKARGPLSSTLMAIVALDDVLALIIYAFALIVAKTMIIHASFSIDLLMHVFYEIGAAFLVGGTSGFLFIKLSRFIIKRERILPATLGMVALTVGISNAFKVDVILSSMLAGTILANWDSLDSEEIFHAVKRFVPPLYILFFVLVGARLDISMVFASGGTVVLLALLLGRSCGKVMGSYLGGIIGDSPALVKRYVGLGLFPQAGVAIGMAISIGHNLSHMGPEIEVYGHMIINMAVASTFIFLIVGPPCVKLAVEKAGEAGRDVNDQDIIEQYKVEDVLDNSVPVIKEDYPLDALVDLVKDSDSDHFCVVDSKGQLFGSISVGDLRSVLLEQELDLSMLILAKDIAVPATRSIKKDQPLQEAIDIFRRKNVDFLPVVKDDASKELVGMIHYRSIMSAIQKEVLLRRGSV